MCVCVCLQTSGNIFHEDLKHVTLRPGPVILNNVLVLEVSMQLNLLLEGLELTVRGREGEGGREKEKSYHTHTHTHTCTHTRTV